jgi:hypothetical protein
MTDDSSTPETNDGRRLADLADELRADGWLDLNDTVNLFGEREITLTVADTSATVIIRYRTAQ